MAKLWLFNSIAKRRRGAGDTFLENGLAALRGHLEGEGHRVRVIDWATEADYAAITPRRLARWNRALAARLLAHGESAGKGVGFVLLFALYLCLQRIEDAILDHRHDRRLKALAQEAAASGVKLFGMKVWFGEAFDWSERLCRHLRRADPEIVVIAGGHHPTLYEEELASRSDVDLAVVSQGEFPLTRLAALADEMTAEGTFSRAAFVRRAVELAESGGLKNTIYRNGDEIKKTGRYPRLNGGVYPPVYEKGEEKAAIHVIIESLGCTWGDCHFCVHRHFYDGYKPRTVDSIVDEMERLRNQGIGIFRFAGSDTPPDLGREIGAAILRRGLVVRFGMGSRALKGIQTPEVYRKAVEAYRVLIRSGLRAVFMGGESGHPWVNEVVMNKGLHPDEVALTIQALREAAAAERESVDLALAMIYPTPTMGQVTHEEVLKANLDLIRRSRPDSVMVTPPGPFRNTVWNKEAKRFGFTLADDWIDVMIRYEYVLYKPAFLWRSIPIYFEGKRFEDALELCGRMRQGVADMGIPTDISDEHFLMLRAAGFEGEPGARAFKHETMLDIVSGDYSTIRDIVGRVNAESRRLASLPSRPVAVAEEGGKACCCAGSNVFSSASR